MSANQWIRRASTVLLLVLCLGLTSCAAQPTSRSNASPASGRGIPVNTRWTLTQVSGPTGTFTVPPRLDGWLALTRNHTLTGRDGCAAFSAREHPETDGISVSGVSETANGCLSDHGVLDATRAAFASLLSPHLTRVVVAKGKLRITARSSAMTFARDKSTAPPRQKPAPPATPSTTRG